MAFPWKVVAAAAVIFAAGVVSGGMAMRLYTQRAAPTVVPTPRPEGPPPPWVGQRMDFMRRMSENLQLTPEQAQIIDRLIKESQQRSRELWESVAPRFQEETRRLKEAVDAVLTPEQRARAEELHRRRFSRPPGFRPPGRWGEGEPPRRRGEEGEPAGRGEGRGRRDGGWGPPGKAPWEPGPPDASAPPPAEQPPASSPEPPPGTPPSP